MARKQIQAIEWNIEILAKIAEYLLSLADWGNV